MFQNTQFKLFVAKIIYNILKLFLKEKRTIVRNGISYDIDLSEGIDLSLFLFGNFQKHVIDIPIKEEAVIYDVGANIGAITLNYAADSKVAKVYSFEPTDFAHEKLVKNVSLNPNLEKKIEVVKRFVGDHCDENPGIIAYSSWSLKGDKADHPVHGGTIKEATKTALISLDFFTHHHDIERVDLIKIDIDGLELAVLKGASETIIKCRPKIIFESGLYILKEHGQDFTQFLRFFKELNYNLFNSANMQPINYSNFENTIPSAGTIDILAIPRELA
jgi:FkbM family methyltransferase